MATTPTPGRLLPVPATSGAWTHSRFFDVLRDLGRLRIITCSGPSTFEALCDLGPYGIAQGYLNAFAEAYHWHLDLARFRHLRSRDETHQRSGRRVLFFELREAPDAPPFLRIYVHREKDAEFGPDRERIFAALHDELASGRPLEAGEDAQ